ncbi:hypothetical protein SAMN05421755_101156 [Nitrosomonas sp. Nm33]|nr:hypothetical protein SAMN05421755_101156 [Nitrosomonas sp. Nm33]
MDFLFAGTRIRRGESVPRVVGLVGPTTQAVRAAPQSIEQCDVLGVLFPQYRHRCGVALRRCVPLSGILDTDLRCGNLELLCNVLCKLRQGVRQAHEVEEIQDVERTAVQWPAVVAKARERAQEFLADGVALRRRIFCKLHRLLVDVRAQLVDMPEVAQRPVDRVPEDGEKEHPASRVGGNQVFVHVVPKNEKQPVNGQRAGDDELVVAQPLDGR